MEEAVAEVDSLLTESSKISAGPSSDLPGWAFPETAILLDESAVSRVEINGEHTEATESEVCEGRVGEPQGSSLPTHYDSWVEREKYRRMYPGT